MYRVTLKPGHPRGIYRRSGREFTREPVQIAAKEITEEIPGSSPSSKLL